MVADTRLRTSIAANNLPINEITAAQRDLDQVHDQLLTAAQGEPDNDIAWSIRLVEYARHLTDEALVAVRRAETHARAYAESVVE